MCGQSRHITLHHLKSYVSSSQSAVDMTCNVLPSPTEKVGWALPVVFIPEKGFAPSRRRNRNLEASMKDVLVADG